MSEERTGSGWGASLGKSRSRARAAARNRKNKGNTGNAKDKSRASSAGSASKTSEKKISGLLRVAIWAVAVVAAIGIPSYVLYQVDSPPRGLSTVSGDLFQEISSNFSFGFDQQNISGDVSFQDDQALMIRWSRVPGGGLEAMYRLGLYSVQNINTRAKLVAMVPASAQLVDCSYEDMNLAAGNQGVQFAPATKARYDLAKSQTEQFYSTPLVPNDDPKGLYYLNFTFLLKNPRITHLGVGKDAIHIQYQGRFSTDPAGSFFPADSAKLRYDTANSNNQSGLPHGVFLEYQSASSETITDAAPAPDTTSEDLQIWVSRADRPTYLITLITEDVNTRRFFELLQGGIFLIIGAVIGATVPRLRRKEENQ